MLGLLFFGILGLWAFAAYKLSKFVVKFIALDIVRKVTILPVFLLVLISPVLDEIIGGFQFRSLCSKNAVLVVDEEKARGKSVIYQKVKDRELKGYLIPILERYWSYKDVSNDEILVGWTDYEATGGWLSRAMSFNSSDNPLTFIGHCAPEDGGSTIFKKLNITVDYTKE
jgi:hypothetical protein